MLTQEQDTLEIEFESSSFNIMNALGKEKKEKK